MSLDKLSPASLREGWIQAQTFHAASVSRETGPATLDFELPDVPQELWQELSLYAEAVRDENRFTSLVSRKAPEEIIHQNILDSLLWAAAWMQVPRETPPLILDAGTGSGVPGIPAMLYLRHLGIDASLILIESNQKKQDFLRRATRDLGNTTVFRGRLESERLAADLTTLVTGDHCPILTSRALATITRTLEWVRPLRPHLREALFFKGPETAEQEIHEATRWESLGWQLADHWFFRFPHRETRLLRLLPSF